MTQSKKKSSALVVFSGGQDSTTCLFWAKNRFDYVEAISFYYGQQHSIELEQGQKICDKLGVKRTLVDISFLKDICDSALTAQDGNVNVSHSRLKDLPASFVPNRNLILLTLANTFAQKAGLDHLITGTCETDFSGYPDCRRLFIDNIEASLFAASNKLSLSVDHIRYTATLYNTSFISDKEEPIIKIEEYSVILRDINKFIGDVGVLSDQDEVLTFKGAEACSYLYNLVRNSDRQHELKSRDDYNLFVEKFHDTLITANEFKVSKDDSNFFLPIHTPLMYLNKAETFSLAEQEGGLEAVLEDSMTCYKGDRTKRHDYGYGCGECPACVLRKKGYEEFLESKK